MKHTALRLAARLAAAAALVALTVLGAATPASAAADRPISDRAYTVTVLQIRAIHETGFTNFGSSDTIKGFFGVGTAPTIGTRTFGGFDAGETRTIAPDQRCVTAPRVLKNNGSSFLTGREGDSWGCSIIGASAPFSVVGILQERDDFLTDIDTKFLEAQLNFSATGLATDLPTLGANRDYTSDLRESGGHYRVTYQVARVL